MPDDLNPMMRWAGEQRHRLLERPACESVRRTLGGSLAGAEHTRRVRVERSREELHRRR